jgi:hypothetical protein
MFFNAETKGDFTMSASTTTVPTVEVPPVLQEASNRVARPLDSGRLTKQVFKAAADSAEFFDHLRAHYRDTRRTSVEIDCDVRLVMADGATFDSGTAVVKNVSPSGALIAGFKLSKNSFPVQAFKVMLVLKGGEYQGIGIEATPVRFVSDVGGLGIKFDEIFVSV